MDISTENNIFRQSLTSMSKFMYSFYLHNYVSVLLSLQRSRDNMSAISLLFNCIYYQRFHLNNIYRLLKKEPVTPLLLIAVKSNKPIKCIGFYSS